jgi:uncharacterized protein (DUF2249 family)
MNDCRVFADVNPTAIDTRLDAENNASYEWSYLQQCTVKSIVEKLSNN